MLKYITTALIALASPALACDDLVLNLGSYHTDRNLITDVNEFNPGLGCRVYTYSRIAEAFEVGFYKNSYGDWTKYFNVTTNRDGWGVFLGYADGYEQDGFSLDGVMPQAGAQYTGEFATFRIGPTLGDTGPGIVVGYSMNLEGF